MQNSSARALIKMDRASFKVSDELRGSKKDTKTGSDHHLHRSWWFLDATIPWNSLSQVKKSNQSDFFSSAAALSGPGKIHHVPSPVRHLEDKAVGMCHQIGGRINEAPSESPGVGRYGNHVIANIEFESLIQKQSHNPKLIDHFIWLKFFKRQSLSLKILKGTEDQFVAPPVMIGLDQYLRFKKNFQIRLFQQFDMEQSREFFLGIVCPNP